MLLIWNFKTILVVVVTEKNNDVKAEKNFENHQVLFF